MLALDAVVAAKSCCKIGRLMNITNWLLIVIKRQIVSTLLESVAV